MWIQKLMPFRKKTNNQATTATTAVQDWLDKPLGQYLLQLEQEQVLKALEPSHSILSILGNSKFRDIVAGAKAPVKILVQPNGGGTKEGWLRISSRLDRLPIAANSVDRIYLPHCLEANINPHEILRETYRVLQPEGYALISCFNPFSLWGLWKLGAAFFSKQPWRYKFMSPMKLDDWLALLGFQVSQKHFYCYTLPISNNWFLQQLHFLESIGKFLNLPFSGSYLVVAYKRLIPLTPIVVSWKQELPKSVLDGDLAPTSHRG